jgi:hypothetical protein
MDEEKKQVGRPQSYTRESQRYAQELELRRHHHEEERQREEAKEKAKDEENAESEGRFRRREKHPMAETGGRRREQENAQKIRVLSGILGLLFVVLIAAIIYEIVLGYGLKESARARSGDRAAWMQQTQELLVTGSDGTEILLAAQLDDRELQL